MQLVIEETALRPLIARRESTLLPASANRRASKRGKTSAGRRGSSCDDSWGVFIIGRGWGFVNRLHTAKDAGRQNGSICILWSGGPSYEAEGALFWDVSEKHERPAKDETSGWSRLKCSSSPGSPRLCVHPTVCLCFASYVCLSACPLGKPVPTAWPTGGRIVPLAATRPPVAWK